MRPCARGSTLWGDLSGGAVAEVEKTDHVSNSCWSAGGGSSAFDQEQSLSHTDHSSSHRTNRLTAGRAIFAA